MMTKKRVFYSDNEKKEIFPASIELENNWINIRKEAINLFDLYSNSKQNIGREYINATEDFWAGWDVIPLRMFGENINANMNLSPTLSEILERNKENIPTAFFSIMRPHKHLEAHYGPFKGILRYHLGLLLPPKEAGDCFISVDNIKYFWKEGEGKLFDETYLHYVENNTNYNRIILFLDVKRSFNELGIFGLIMDFINDLILWFIQNSPHNQEAVRNASKQLLNILNPLPFDVPRK